ncbi:MAG TPA: type IV secretory system conjugative DNA transfer family protein [Rickettsiales bacterium]|nr:type IV secretory system conjugative DNA transfer family protein [Rickettsiales bacterium]
MSKAQDEQIIAFRNFVILGSLSIIILILCLYITGLFIIFLTQNINALIRIFSMDFPTQIIYITNVFIQSWQAVLINFTKIGFSGVNYFVTKIAIGSFTPLSIFLYIIYKYREPIFEWRPFKIPESQYGNAHWATIAEMKKAGLMHNGTGMTMGIYKGKLLVVDKINCEHALLFAPTGSGKGTGFVIPNLLFWDDSVIVHDVKLENFQLTSGYRTSKMRQKCYLWNPADQDGYTHCYNPMDFISKEYGSQVDDVMKITKFLLPKEEFWTNEGRALTTGIMLALLALDDRPTSMGEVLRTLRSDDVSYNIAVILDTKGEQIHPTGYMNLASYLQKPDKERGSVTSTAASALDLWANPLVDAATMKSDFNIGTFRVTPTSLFVGISPSNVTRLQPLLQIFYQQCASIFTKRLPDKKKEKCRVMMLLDEFPTLGKMEEIKSGIAYYRGYWVKLFLITQDTEQLKAIYETSGMNSFLSNCKFRITYAANNVDTAKYISDLLGEKTLVTQEEGSRPKYLDLNPGARQVSTKKSGRKLLMPQEVIGLPQEEQIILTEANPPVKCKKVVYWKDKLFTSRLMKPIKVPKQEAYIPKKKKLPDKK